MQQYPVIFLSVLCLFSKTTSSVPLDVQTKDDPQSSPFIILPQSAQAQSDSDIYQVEDNVVVVTPASSINPLTTTTNTTTNTRTTTARTSTMVDDVSGERKPPVSISPASPVPADIEAEEAEEHSIEDNSHWDKISSFQLSEGLSVEKYRSSLTGLTVVLANAESPIVNGYFCLATEV